jgi:branched-chain amino acid transport system substrate-binding protein
VITGWGIGQGFALLGEMQQTGYHPKVYIFNPTPPATLLQNPQTHALAQGIWTATNQVPPQANDPATQQFKSALETYEHMSSSQASGVGADVTTGWIIASAVIQGLQAAGRNPTRASYIAALRNVSDFTGGGLYISPLSFKATDATGSEATYGPKACTWFMQYKGSAWIPQAAPFCDGYVAGS